MPRPRKAVPEYLLHKPSGHAYCRISKPGGGRAMKFLGVYGSPESRRLYTRVLAELEAAPPVAPPAAGLFVEDVVERFLLWARGHYRRSDGSVTQELDECVRATAPLVEMYGADLASSIGPLALKAVRVRMIKAGWCRKLVNKRIGRIKRCFKWAASEELIPITTLQALTTVQGLQHGRTEARETEPVKPVPDTIVTATLPHLIPEVAAMVQIQRLAAMRPQDVCNLRPCDLDRSRDVWVYRPGQHKGAWRGKVREVLIGPRAQAVLQPFLEGVGADECVFSPRRTLMEFRARLRAARKSKVTPSQEKRAKRSPKKQQPKDRYTSQAYCTAIYRGCDRAFPPPGDLAPRPGESRRDYWSRLTEDDKRKVKAWRTEHRWAPNQLRHAAATEIRERYGAEAAQVMLGHERLSTTEIYAERNSKLGQQVALERG